MPLDFPANPTNGQYYNGFVYNAANSSWDSAYNPGAAAIPGAWTAYTPTVYNFTVGNGTTSAYYVQIGKTVSVRYRFIVGSTTNFTGTPVISLPVAMKQAAFLTGSGSITNAQGVWPLIPNTQDGDKAALYAILVNGTYAQYTGWIGAINSSAGAALEFNMTYEAV